MNLVKKMWLCLMITSLDLISGKKNKSYILYEIFLLVLKLNGRYNFSRSSYHVLYDMYARSARPTYHLNYCWRRLLVSEQCKTCTNKLFSKFFASYSRFPTITSSTFKLISGCLLINYYEYIWEFYSWYTFY